MLIDKIILSDYIFLVPLFIIGVIVSFEDYRYGKIKNKWIKIGFLYGAIMFGLIIFRSFFSDPLTIDFSYLSHILVNTIIASVVGCVMWYWTIWSAGDAKLFSLFAFLLPLEFYSNTYLSYFPSFALLINIFIIALIIFLIMLVLNFIFYMLNRRRIITEEEKKARKERIKRNIYSFIGEIFNLFIVFFVMVSLVGIIFRSALKERLFYFFNTTLGLENWVLFITVLAIFIFLVRFLRKLKKIFYTIAILLFIWLLYTWFRLGQSPMLTIKPMIGMTAVLVFGGFTFRKAFDWYVNKKEVEEIDVGNIKKGTRLTEESLKVFKTKSPTTKSLKESMGRIYSDGLSKEQSIFLKKLAGEKKIKKIKVYKLSPFAIWIFIGLITTIIFKGSIVKLFL